jgi:hypothetical protein
MIVVGAAAVALIAAAPAGAIYHGTPVAAGDAPWSVTLTARSVACGGALIGRTRRASGTPLGCSVTARTAGGWATEDSYNLL